MGADFLLYCVPRAKIDAGRKQRLMEIVAGATEDDESGDYDDVQEYRDALANAVEFLQVAEKSRETALFSLPGSNYKVVITGGMSTGDAPTDAAETFRLFENCPPLWEQLEVWATEDFKANRD